jgi:DNA-binding transcriptional LysR family regulator
LRVAQSAVSQALKALEGELGVVLLSRTKRRVALTPAGYQFLEHGRRTLDALAHAASAARRAASGEIGRLVLRFSLLTGLSPIPRAVARFREECPGVELVIEHGGSAANIDAVRAGRADLGFVVYRRAAPPLACEVVSEEPLVALLPRAHPLAKRRRVSFADLADEPRIVLSRHSEPELHARYYARSDSLPPLRIALEADQIDTVLGFVAAGFGVAHAPASVTRLRMEGVVAVPLAPAVASGVSAVWDEAALSPAGRRFLAAVRAAARAAPAGARLRRPRR